VNFHALVRSLGGRPFIGHDDYYHIDDFTIEQIRARAGTRGSVQRIGGHVLLQFPVTEGTAVILGAVDATDGTEMLHDSDILLIDVQQRGRDRRTHRIARTPPPN
jgi:hypothetical protein